MMVGFNYPTVRDLPVDDEEALGEIIAQYQGERDGARCELKEAQEAVDLWAAWLEMHPAPGETTAQCAEHPAMQRAVKQRRYFLSEGYEVPIIEALEKACP